MGFNSYPSIKSKEFKFFLILFRENRNLNFERLLLIISFKEGGMFEGILSRLILQLFRLDEF